MPAYRRVPTADGSYDPDAAKRARQARLARTATVETISNKIHALFWCVLAGFVLVKTDFISVAFMSPTVNRSYFNLALVCIAINTVIAFYLCIYLPCFVRTELPWSVYCPRMIPTMTGVGTVCAILLLKSLWPVWGFLTPLILISLGMGAMFSLHFIPFLP